MATAVVVAAWRCSKHLRRRTGRNVEGVVSIWWQGDHVVTGGTPESGRRWCGPSPCRVRISRSTIAKASMGQPQGLVEELQAMGGGPSPCRRTSPAWPTPKMVAKVVEELGAVHILVCNAGMNWDSVIWKMSEEQFDRVIDVDPEGAHGTTRACARISKSRTRFISVTSINGLPGQFGQTCSAARAAPLVSPRRSQELDRAVSPGRWRPVSSSPRWEKACPAEFKQATVDEQR